MSVTQLFVVIHLLAISFTLGIGFANIVGFRVAKGLGGDKALGIATQRESLIPYTDVFFVVIIASGLVLLWGIGGPQGISPWFHVKMAAVAVWIVVYIAMRWRIRNFLASRDLSLVTRIRLFAHIGITAAVVAVICAVMAFNA